MRAVPHLQLPPVVVEHLAAGHDYLWSCALCVRAADLDQREKFPLETSSASADGEGASKVEGVI